MTFDEFIKNVRGVNDGKDFPEPVLKSIWDAVAAKELNSSAHFARSKSKSSGGGGEVNTNPGCTIA